MSNSDITRAQAAADIFKLAAMHSDQTVSRHDSPTYIMLKAHLRSEIQGAFSAKPGEAEWVVERLGDCDWDLRLAWQAGCDEWFGRKDSYEDKLLGLIEQMMDAAPDRRAIADLLRSAREQLNIAD